MVIRILDFCFIYQYWDLVFSRILIHTQLIYNFGTDFRRFYSYEAPSCGRNLQGNVFHLFYLSFLAAFWDTRGDWPPGCLWAEAAPGMPAKAGQAVPEQLKGLHVYHMISSATKISFRNSVLFLFTLCSGRHGPRRRYRLSTGARAAAANRP